MNKLLRNRNRGFTMIELIVVLAILGILILLATPNFLGQTRDIQGKEITNNIKFVTYRTSMYDIKNETDITEGLPEIDSADIISAYNEQRLFDENGYAHISFAEGFYDLSGTENVKEVYSNVEGTYAIKEDIVFFISEDKLNVSMQSEEDTTPPIIIIGNYPVDPTNQDVTVCVTTNEGYLNQDCYTFTNNGTFEFIAEDLSGNKTTQEVTVNFIDKLAPEITMTPDGDMTERKSHSSIVTIEDKADQFNAANGVAESGYAWSINPSASYESLSWDSITTGNNASIDAVTGDYYLYVYSTDTLGNYGMQRSAQPFRVDNTPPVKPSISADTETGVGYIDITFSSDSVQKEYKIDSGAWTSYTGQIVLNNNATMYARGIDLAGNTSDVTELHIIVDMEPPVVTFSLNGNNTYEKQHNTKVTVTDEKSGVDDASLQYIWSTSTIAPTTGWTNLTNGATLSTPSSTTDTHYLFVKAADTIGNTTTVMSNAFRTDNTVPMVSFGTNGSTTYKRSHSTTVSVSDSHSGVSTRQYAWSASTITPTTGWTSFADGAIITRNTGTGDIYLHIKTTDAAGNVSDIRTNVFRMDNTIPTVSFGTNGSTTAKKSHSTTVSVSDSHSGVSARQYAWSTSTATPTAGWTSFTDSATITQSAGTGNYYLHVRATDAAGNISDITSNAFNMDNTAPALPTVTHTTTATTTGTVTMAANFPADAVIKQYKLSTTASWSNYTGARTVQNNATFHFRSADAAGNYSGTKSHTISNITPRYYHTKYNNKVVTTYTWRRSTIKYSTVRTYRPMTPAELYNEFRSDIDETNTNNWTIASHRLYYDSTDGWLGRSSSYTPAGLRCKRGTNPHQDRCQGERSSNPYIRTIRFAYNGKYWSYYTDYRDIMKYTSSSVAGRGSLIGNVSSTSNIYPNGGASGSYWYDQRTTSTSNEQGTLNASNVIGTNYPTNGRHTDGYWYVRGSKVAP